MVETGIATGLNSIYRELHKFERGLRPYQNNIQQTMKIFLKILLILGGIGFVIFVGFMGIMIAAFGGFDKDYSVSELKENFEEKKAEIYELKNYINKIIPPDKSVEIEFENNNTLGIFLEEDQLIYLCQKLLLLNKILEDEGQVHPLEIEKLRLESSKLMTFSS